MESLRINVPNKHTEESANFPVTIVKRCEYYHIERSFCHAIDVADRVLIVCVKILKYQCCILSRKEVVVYPDLFFCHKLCLYQ